MPHSLQNFLAFETRSAAAELAAALDRIPADKRIWKPGSAARSALDQFAECALLNGNTADLIHRRAGKPLGYGIEFEQLKAVLVKDEPAARALLTENTARAITAISGIPDAALNDSIPLPWGSMTLCDLITFPCWNMIYHVGQINYILSLLGKNYKDM